MYYMKNIVPLLLTAFFALSLYSCSSEETVAPVSNDTLSYSFNNLNDSVVTITYAIGGSTSSQPVSWTVNLNKSILQLRHNMTYYNGGTMTINSYNDTTKRFFYTLNSVKDTLMSKPGPSTRIELVPSNFKGRGTITVAK